MEYFYYLCDVFTDVPFQGNQLAVFPHALGLTDEEMQRIARELNFSETTFVLPPEKGLTRRVRIFTPIAEIPFAGHPNLGTASVLAEMGELGDPTGSKLKIAFEEPAGVVRVRVERRKAHGYWAEVEAPEKLSLGRSINPELFARAVSLETEDVIVDVHPPRVASVGLPFVIAEIRNRDALARARPNMMGVDALISDGITPDLHLYTQSHDSYDLRARMFAPLDGVAEDPATGSANCALAAMLSHYDRAESGSFQWRIAQGIEMGRPSLLEARTEKKNGEVVATWIAGHTMVVGKGSFFWREISDG